MQFDRSRFRIPISPAVAFRWLHRTSRDLLSVAVGAISLVSFGACAPSDDDLLEEIREHQTDRRMEQSIPILIRLIESGNRQGEVLYRYGRALSLTGKPERSVWALDAAREDPQWFVRASHQLALDAHQAGNFEFAREIFARLHEEAPEESADDLYSMLLEARVLIDSQDHFEEALELVESLLERFPEEETAIRMKAAALLGLKRPDEAYQVLRDSGVAPSAAGVDGEIGAEAGAVAENEGKRESSAVAGEVGADDEEKDSGLYLEIEDESREAYWCTVRATFKREAGETEEATKLTDECLARFPNATELIGEAVKLYSDLGRFDRVLEILEKAFAESPDDPEIRSALVQFLTRIGRTKEVEKILRKTLDDAIAAGRGATLESASHWIDLAGFLMEQDRVGEALVAFDSANKILGDSASPNLLLREAEALIRAKEYDQALAMAEQTPVEVHGEMLRGRIAFERGDYRKALDDLGKAALLWPDNAPIRYYRARAAEGLGDFDMAIEDYRHAIRSDSTLSAARERLASLHLAEGNVREASTILVFQSPRKPSTPSTAMRILMVEVECRRGTEPDVEIPPDASHSLEEVRMQTIRALGRGLRSRTNARVAAGVLAELEKEADPQLRGSFLRERVELLGAYGDLAGALAQARAGLKVRPDDLDSQLAVARMIVASGSVSDEVEASDEAEGLLRGVLEKRPDEVDALTALGDLHSQRKQLAKADDFYERALKLAPDSWAAFAPRIANLFAAGKADEGMARLEAFVARDAPYEGRGALELARRLPEDQDSHARRIQLLEQAIRFGAGEPALELLASLDPEAAAQYATSSGEEPDRSEAAPESAGSASHGVSDAVSPPEAPAEAALPIKGSPAKPKAG